MGMEKHVGVLVFDSDGVEVSKLCWTSQEISAFDKGRKQPRGAFTFRVHQQFVTHQRFLERRAHKAIARARVAEDLEMDPEEREVDAERDDDQADHSGQEMFREPLLCKETRWG